MELNRISVTRDGRKLVLDFSSTLVPDDVVMERFEELAVIFDQILASDEAWWQLSDELTAVRLKSKLARDMIYQASLQRAHREAVALRDTILGDSVDSAYSFPEFVSDRSPNSSGE